MTTSTTQTPATVLVANDEPEVLNMLKRLLEHDGYRVVVADDGQRALELAFTVRPDVIISDVVMPFIDGVELCRRLKADGRTQDVPVLLMSARRKGDGDSLEGLIAGADDYLGMPFRSQELMVKVARLAERHRVENYYRIIFEQAADIVYTCDMQGRITGINKAGERFFGRPASALAGVLCDELFDAGRDDGNAGSDGSGDRSDAGSRKEFSDGSLHALAVHHVRDAGGTWRYLETVTTVVRDVDGAATSLRSTARDVTERFEAEQRLNASMQQLETLTALATAVKNPSEVDQLFEGLADSITRFTDYRTSLVTLLTDEPPYHPRVLSYSSNIPPEFAAQITTGSYPRDEMSQIIKHGMCIEVGEFGFAAYYPPSRYHVLDRIVPDRFKAKVERHVPTEGARWHEGDELFVPLVTRDGDYIGFISLDDPRSGRAPDRESVLPVVAFARQITQLLAQQQAAEALAAQVEREALINRITSAVRHSLDPAEVFRTAVNELGSHLDVDRCALFMLDRESGVVRSVAEYTAEGVAPAGREYSIALVNELIEPIRQQGILAFDDVASDERTRHVYEDVLPGLGTRSVMYAAIRVGEEAPAAFVLSTLHETRHWRATDITLARAVADQTGIAIRQAELFDMVARAKRTWETTFDAMSDGIFIFDSAHALARVNRAGAALEDASPQELLGRRCCDVLRAGAGEGCIVEKAFAEGRAITLEYMPERLMRPLLVTAEPLREGAQITGTVCTVRDLSELRQAEREARERQSLLENILESARETIYALDAEGRIQWCNSAALTTGGYRREDLIGIHYLEKTYVADRTAVTEHFTLALAGEPQTYETRYLANDGSVRFGFVDNAPLVIDGRITGVLGILRDITEQKQERERVARADKLRALGQLASGVAHDFNNALAAILGRTQLLRHRTGSDPEVAHSLDIIQTAAEDAAATVRRISTFARPSRSAEFERLDVSELLRDAVEITRTRWEHEALRRGLHYVVPLDAESGLLVDGSASELREVFVNLIVNALDAMPQGGELSIRAMRDTSHVHLFFTDTGAGMTGEVRERIFEPFFSTKGMQGTGLGLFVSYGIVERHKGRLSVESETGRGTTFTLDLPCAEDACDETGQQDDAANEARPLSVLVVDDEPFVRDTLVEMLRALGHDVASADGGEAALDALAHGTFDLVFTDLSMPEMDGWQVAREIRRRHGQKLRLVIVTGYGKDTTEPSGDSHIVDGVIGKPFDFAQVEETITRITERQPIEDI